MLGTYAYAGCITSNSNSSTSTTLAAAVRQIFRRTLLAGKVCGVREERVYITLTFLLAIWLLLTQTIDGFDAVLDGTEAIVDVLASAQRDASVGAGACDGGSFLEQKDGIKKRERRERETASTYPHQATAKGIQTLHGAAAATRRC